MDDLKDNNNSICESITEEELNTNLTMKDLTPKKTYKETMPIKN